MKTYYKMLVVLAVLVVIGTGAWLYRSYEAIKASALEARRAQIAVYAQQRAAALIKAEDFSTQDISRQQRLFAAFFEAIQSPEIFRVKVFDSKPKIIWSNLKEIIGQDASDNQEALDALKQGKITMKFKSLKPEQVSERQFREFTETYVPIPDGNGKIVGVIEVYKTAFSLNEKIRSDLQKSVTSAFVAALAGYAVMALVLGFIMRAKGKSPS